MLKQGVIEPVQSLWSSPIVLMKERDGKWRFCVECMRLNEVTTKYVYLVPRIEDALSKLEETALLSVGNLPSGYWIGECQSWEQINQRQEIIPTSNRHGIDWIEVDCLPGFGYWIIIG